MIKDTVVLYIDNCLYCIWNKNKREKDYLPTIIPLVRNSVTWYFQYIIPINKHFDKSNYIFG